LSNAALEKIYDDRRLFGHPVGLGVLFLTEMWERFSYYGMRGLLKLYMVNYLFVVSRQIVQGGEANAVGDPNAVIGWEFIRNLISSDPTTPVGAYASVLYGWYTGFVYATPILGGYLADRYWGQRKTVILGGSLMALGHFAMAFENWFFIALLLLIIGNGAFKPNISTQVGNLYRPGDPRRDGAFTIFYMGINLGAFICNLICGTLAATKGWHWGFGAAGIGMLLGLIIYIFGQSSLAPDSLTVSREKATADAPATRAPLSVTEWQSVKALILLCVLNIVFWAVYEQQGNTMQTWADEKTVWPIIAGFQVPATWFQSINPFFIFALAPLFDILWRWQASKNQEPTSVQKMAIGSALLGASFIIMVFGARAIGDGAGSWFWPVSCTILLTIGELYLSPIGLSLVTKVSPARIVSIMMGVWMASSFFGNIVSGYIGLLYETKTVSNENFFWILTALGMATGAVMWAFSKPLDKIIARSQGDAVAAK
jgi:POT family proton-dependent oligopeptide transporter